MQHAVSTCVIFIELSFGSTYAGCNMILETNMSAYPKTQHNEETVFVKGMWQRIFGSANGFLFVCEIRYRAENENWGAIQIIRDTLAGGRQGVTHTLFCFYNSDLMLFEGGIHVWNQD